MEKKNVWDESEIYVGNEPMGIFIWENIYMRNHLQSNQSNWNEKGPNHKSDPK